MRKKVFLIFIITFVLFFLRLACLERFQEKSYYNKTHSASFTGINYDSRSTNPKLSTVKIFEEKVLAQNQVKDINISFRINIYSISNWNNVFQTDHYNEGIRFELAEPNVGALVVGYEKDNIKSLKGFNLLDSYELNRWYSVDISLEKNINLKVIIDNKILFDIKDEDINCDIRKITVGQGFNDTRRFDGIIEDFKIEYKFFKTKKIIAFSHIIKKLQIIFKGFFSFFLIFIIAYILFLIRNQSPNIFSALLLTSFVVLSSFSIFKVLISSASRLSLDSNLFYSAFVFFMISIVFYFIDLKMKKNYLFLFLIPIIFIVAGKSQALVSVLIFGVASLGIGINIYKYFNSYDNFVIKYGVSFFIGVCVNAYILWFLMHFKINYVYTHIILYLLEIFLFRYSLIDFFGEFKKKINGYSFSLGQKVLIIYAIFLIFYSIIIVYQWDDLVGHLYIAKCTKLFGMFNFSPAFPYGLDNAIFPKACFTSLFIMAGESGIKMLMYSLFFITFFLIEHFSRLKFGKRTAFFATLVCILTPFIAWEISEIFIDVFAFLPVPILLIYCLDFYEKPDKKKIILFFIISAFAYFSKQQTVFIIIPVSFIVLLRILQETKRIKNYLLIRYIFFGFFVALSIAFLPLFQNYLLTKNPFFPFLNEIFNSEYINPRLPRVYAYFYNIWRDIYDITFNGVKPAYYTGYQYSFGLFYFVFFFLSPVTIFLLRKHRKEFYIMFFIFISSVITWLYLLTGPQVRYFITCLPVGSVIIGMTINSMIDVFKSKKVYLYPFLTMLTILFITSWICQIKTHHLPKYSILEIFKKNPKKHWVLGHDVDKVKSVFDYAAKKYGKNSKCLHFHSPALYFADFKISTYDWYNYSTGVKINSVTTAQDAFNLIFNELKFDFLILTKSRPGTVLDRLVETEMIVKDFSRGGYSLYIPNKKHPIHNPRGKYVS